MQMKRMTLRFTPAQMAKLKAAAASRGRSVSAVIRELIQAEPEPRGLAGHARSAPVASQTRGSRPKRALPGAS